MQKKQLAGRIGDSLQAITCAKPAMDVSTNEGHSSVLGTKTSETPDGGTCGRGKGLKIRPVEVMHRSEIWPGPNMRCNRCPMCGFQCEMRFAAINLFLYKQMLAWPEMKDPVQLENTLHGTQGAMAAFDNAEGEYQIEIQCVETVIQNSCSAFW